MTTTATRMTTREHIDPILKAIITRELTGQGAPQPQAILGTQQQQPEVALTALIPALIAAVTSQSQQVAMPMPPSPLTILFPFMMTTEMAIVTRHPQLLNEFIDLRLQLAPIMLAALASQRQQIPVPQQSPLTMLLPVLIAALTMQQQPARPSPILSALSCALAPTIVSAITGKSKEGEGRASQRSGR